MSRTPPSQCGHPPPDASYTDPGSHSRHPAQMPVTYHPYHPHDPRHFLPLDVSYNHPVLTAPHGARMPSIGHVQERDADPRRMLSSENLSMNQPSMHHTLPLRMHHYEPSAMDPRGYLPAPNEERPSPMLSQGRDSHRMRTYDLESQ